MANLGVGSKLRFYKTFKNSFNRESYLDTISEFDMRKIVTKFRCSDHSLQVEIGRHRKIKFEDRVCKLCLNDVETELHFLKSCPIYKNIRRQIFGDNPVQNWENLLKCKDRDSTYKLASFLTKAFKLRDNMLALHNVDEA